MLPAAARRLAEALRRPVPDDALVLARACFGALMVAEVARAFLRGWIERYYVAPVFFFTYPGLSWVRPLGEIGMRAVFVLLALCAAVMALGRWARAAALVFLVAFAYVFLIDQTNYLNHFYLIGLVALHFALAPIGAGQVPRFWLLAFRFVVALPYVFGGIAKLEPDWLRGLPLQMWLGEHPRLGLALEPVVRAWVAQVMAGAGIAFDLLVVPGLLWRRTRPFAFVAAVLFHGLNAYLFNIGVFPPLMLALSTLLLDPGWPRRFRLWAWLRPRLAAGGPTSPVSPRLVGAWVLLFAVPQLLVPLRHLLHPGRVSWTEEGHLFAWHMKLRDKKGTGIFFARDPLTGVKQPIDHRAFLTPRQEQQMLGRPRMVIAFARFLREEFFRRTGRWMKITAEVRVSLNGRPPQLLVHPGVDLASVEGASAGWILPLR